MHSHAPVMLLLLLAAAISTAQADRTGEKPEARQKAESDVLFKTYDRDGNAVYSDQRPVDEEGGVQVIDPASLEGNVMEQRQDMQEYRRELLEDAEERDEAEEQKAKRVEEAKERLEEARKALEEGKEPDNNDWQRTVEQRRFLKPSYFERVERLEREVTEAKEALKKARRAPADPD